MCADFWKGTFLGATSVCCPEQGLGSEGTWAGSALVLGMSQLTPGVRVSCVLAVGLPWEEVGAQECGVEVFPVSHLSPPSSSFWLCFCVWFIADLPPPRSEMAPLAGC